MARRSIRTSSGRLKAGERRRRINASAAKPGEVVLLDSTRRRRRGGVQHRNAVQIDLVVETQWSVDMDVRKLLHELRIELATYYRDQLLKGQRADGNGPLPELKRDDGSGRTYGVRSGAMANLWGISKITGGPFRASVKLRPYAEGERAAMIARALRAGVDFQSVEGGAAELIRRVTQEWIRKAVPASGDGVATPESVPSDKEGQLPNFEK